MCVHVRVSKHASSMRVHAAYVYLAESAQPRGKCDIDTIDVHLMRDLHGQASRIQALNCLAAPALFHANPLIGLIEAEDFYMCTALPLRLRSELIHHAQHSHCRWL